MQNIKKWVSFLVKLPYSVQLTVCIYIETNTVLTISFLHSEIVVAKLLNKSGSATGAESTGNIQVGDVVTGISINEEPMQYLATGPIFDQQQHLDQVFSTLLHARGHIRLQLERSDHKASETINVFFRPYSSDYQW
jgi:hypothetical protein